MIIRAHRFVVFTEFVPVVLQCFQFGGLGSLLYSSVGVIRLLGSTANVRSVLPGGVRLGTLARYQSKAAISSQ